MKFTPAPNYPLPLSHDGVVRLPPPPPQDRWVTDVLGAPFQARTLRLAPDAEGEVFATLVRAQGSPSPPHRLCSPLPRSNLGDSWVV